MKGLSIMILQNTKSENSLNHKQAYTVQEIAKILEVGERTAYNLCSKTKDFRVLHIGKCVRINKESFDRWFDACDIAGN